MNTLRLHSPATTEEFRAERMVRLVLRSLSGLLVIISLGNGFSVRLQAQDQKPQTIEEIRNEIRNARVEGEKEVKESLEPESGITNASTRTLERIKAGLDKAGQVASGDEAAVSRVMSAHAGRLLAASKNYQKAAEPLNAQEILDVGSLTNVLQIGPRREIVKKFAVANLAMLKVLDQAEDKVKEGLQQEGISGDTLEKFMQIFRKGAVPRTEIMKKMYACDTTLANSMLAILDVLEKDWGKWKYRKDDNTVEFDDPKAAKIHSDAMEAIQQAGQKQLEEQEKLVKMMD